MNNLLFFIPLAGALIGWCSNRCLTWIVFRKKELIAKSLAQYSKTIFKPEELLNKLGHPGNLEKIRPLIDEHLDQFLRVKLAKEMPFITAFIGDKTINQLKGLFMTELEALFPQIMNTYAGTLSGEFNVEQLVLSKMNQSSVNDELRNSFGKQLRMLEWAGAAVGFLLGLLIMIILLVV